MFVRDANGAWAFDPEHEERADQAKQSQEAVEPEDEPDKRGNELDIARAIAEKRLTSPQQYHNIWLFALRVTGTGASYRPEFKEHVWRDPGIYLTADFCARIAGLPVIWWHPPDDQLDQHEYRQRVIGAVMLPYIEEDEVWCVARLYDQDAAQIMREKQLSTSPSVTLPPGKSQTRKLEGGRTLLIESEPDLVDHLAVCEAGVWDKGGEPTGIAIGEPEVAEGPSEETPVIRLDRLGTAIDELSGVINRL